jgi:hypothetical protein
MKVNGKVAQKVKRNLNFHKWKGIWIYKRHLNQFPFHIKALKKKTIMVSCAYVYPLCKKEEKIDNKKIIMFYFI